jgi:hypothetical protein
MTLPASDVTILVNLLSFVGIFKKRLGTIGPDKNSTLMMNKYYKINRLILAYLSFISTYAPKPSCDYT